MPNTMPPRGVRKISELITQKGRALILSEEDASKLSWPDIPVSTLKINSKTGIMSVKLEGESDWVPAGVKNDGTLCIAKDGRIVVENFTVTQINLADKTFSYETEAGDTRHSVIDDNKGFIFVLEVGSYQPGRNQIDVTIDDVLARSKASGGLIEISEIKFGIKDSLVVGQEVTAKYSCVLRIGSPYPRFFLSIDEPEVKLAEIGDFWLDYDADINTELGTLEGDPNEISKRISWSDIVGKPDTVYGYGIKDKISYEGHVHKKSDIVDFPTSFKADGGNADTVNWITADHNKPNTLAILDSDGKISLAMLPEHRHKMEDIEGLEAALIAAVDKANKALEEAKRIQDEVKARLEEALNKAEEKISKIDPLNEEIKTNGCNIESAFPQRVNYFNVFSYRGDSYGKGGNFYTSSAIGAGTYKVNDVIQKLIANCHSHSMGSSGRCRCDRDHG